MKQLFCIYVRNVYRPIGQGCQYRDKSIDIGGIADTFPVSVMVAAIVFERHIDCCIGDTFRVDICQYSIPILLNDVGKVLANKMIALANVPSSNFQKIL